MPWALRDAGHDDVAAMAALLVEGFASDWPDAFPDLDTARAAVLDVLAQGVARAAVSTGEIVGWIGGLPQYDGRVWELHPLVVAPARQGQGIGRALVRDLEASAFARGALTLVLGTDDETAMTSLSGVDLYDDLPGRLATVTARKRHPFVFYQKLGFVISGCVPDANGPGKPDILMAKRVACIIGAK
jgi:aminoglycoside 6'-N-acetyltransferase I